MAINSRGFDGAGSQLDEGWWAKLQRLVGMVNNAHGIASGGVVSPGTGADRLLSVSQFEALFPGVIAESTGAETIAAGANTGGSNRLDYLCLTANWGASAVGGISPNTVGLQVVAGSTALPSLTQQAGTLWQMPLAAVTVRPGSTAIGPGDIAEAKPVPRRIVYRTPAVSTATVWASATSATLATVSVPDPGWAYRLDVSARVRVRAATGTYSGQANVFARWNGAAFGNNLSADLQYGADTVVLTAVSAQLSGAGVFTLTTQPSSLPDGTSYEIPSSSMNECVIRQVPVGG